MKQLIYSVEDDDSIRELINYALINEDFEVVSFITAEACLSAFEKRLPSLLLLDIMLPGMDGIEALEFVRRKYKNLDIKIIMLTAKNSEMNKVIGLNCGADDYITKPFSVLEFIARIKAHLRQRSVGVSDGIIEISGVRLNPRSREVEVCGQSINLTYLEFEILKTLMENSGNVMTREMLLTDIWGTDYFGESRTVDIHIKNIRAKLDKKKDLIVSARGVGYILKDDAT
ncbi:MAG: response regulator transcription factor [Christensenellaceae bacterium]|nr:response regulator transcription factor [Christensenellaceae bacterium]